LKRKVIAAFSPQQVVMCAGAVQQFSEDQWSRLNHEQINAIAHILLEYHQVEETIQQLEGIAAAQSPRREIDSRSERGGSKGWKKGKKGKPLDSSKQRELERFGKLVGNHHGDSDGGSYDPNVHGQRWGRGNNYTSNTSINVWYYSLKFAHQWQ
jgi:hypothetical protein